MNEVKSLAMDFVLTNQDLVEKIIKSMDKKTVCNFRQTSKTIKNFVQSKYSKELQKHTCFKIKQNESCKELYNILYETEIEYLHDLLDPQEYTDFTKFYNEVVDNSILYNILMLTSESEEDVLTKITKIHRDFLDEHLIIYE
jgi:translation elongation factor EF-G